MIFKLVQKEAFPTEFVALTGKKELSSKASVAQLRPFIDDNGIMRARGRLSKADFVFDTNHPFLLPSKHRKLQLVMLKSHLDNCHQGVESMRHELQQQFWILGLRNALRSIKSPCVLCRKYSANVQVPLMADIPRERVEKVDFPINVSFVMRKTREAPIKTTTIPKLELQAALHASRIKASFLEDHDIAIDRVHMWSDSTTVIQWLNAFDKKRLIFVANRIEEIMENTKLGV